jgi:hypothetical protein
MENKYYMKLFIISNIHPLLQFKAFTAVNLTGIKKYIFQKKLCYPNSYGFSTQDAHLTCDNNYPNLNLYGTDKSHSGNRHT